MAIITPALLTALYTGYRAEYQRVYGETPTSWEKIATLMPSTSKSNTYGWLGQFPKLVEWIGPRVLKDMAAQGYTITNKLFEASVSVPRVDIEDDSVGVYKPLFGEMGRAAKSFPDELIFGLLGLGRTTLCYDNQYFFDVDHPVYPNVDGTGAAATVANFIDEAGGTPWYLLDTSRVIKPLIFQERTKPELTAMTKTDDESVFMSDVYRYGVRYRCNGGFGFWQTAFCSKKTLSTDNFNAAYDAMCAFAADGGRPLGIKPTLLVVPTTLRTKANETITVSRLANGADNPNAGIVDVLVTPWLN